MQLTIEEYIERFSSPESDVLSTITHDTNLYVLNPHMLSGQVQGRLLSMLSHMLRPERILELGTFTGYSALCLAEGLSESGTLTTLEHNDELEDTILHNLSLSPLGKKIELHIGDAKKIIQNQLQGEVFNLMFIDADKREYDKYFDLLFPLLRQGGYMLADNTLWDGHIVDPAYDRDPQTNGLRIFNEKIANDPRVEQVILPIRDGLTIIRKL